MNEIAMSFDAATWWLAGVLLTALLGVVGALISRSIYTELDDHDKDIKQIRENYTTRTQHEADLRAIRQEMKEMRTEMRHDIQCLSDDIKEVKETCLRKEDFLRSIVSLENKLDNLHKYIIEGRGRNGQ